MRTLFKKTALATSLLLVSAGFASVASAHCFNSSGSQPLLLGSATNTHDLYRLQCFDDGNGNAERVEAAVQKQSANVTGLGVRVQIAREGYAPSAIKSDTAYASGDSIDTASCTAAAGSTPTSAFAVLRPQLQTGAPNAAADAGNANGEYNILVDKSDLHPVSQRYGIIFHCLNAAGDETGTAQVSVNGRAPELLGNDTFGPLDDGDIDLSIDQ
ncbi:MAG: hypothetical protein PHH59_09915 [Methylovulum sp.]|uniref:hypothetical protein n=1 Tax=Methylovulum sp. TaxID=1916980 RepID=UPI00260D631C|nr:hypothetical protein [Methylovulum sp.]MDD2724322.1 hypothetical protein [Methylovulum sp.]MDD5124966.1 hypothetical protein [Methylovulum sp.]